MNPWHHARGATEAPPAGHELAPLVADFYAEAPAPLRVKLLRTLLRPVGPLALAGIAAGAFASLLPSSRWQGARVTPESVSDIGADAVFELVRYVEQKSPELFASLPDAVGDSRMWMASVSGALLLMALRAIDRERRGGA